MLYADHGRDMKTAMSGYGYIVMIYGLRPLSRGHVGLHSADPFAAPLIDPNYMAEPADVERLVRGGAFSPQDSGAAGFRVSPRGRDIAGTDAAQ